MFLQNRGNILDVGCGNGAFVLQCRQAGMNVETIDIRNKSAFVSVTPVLYDGKKLPFQDKAFESVMFITVLHHTLFPEELIKEAMRIGERLVILEDVYENKWQKHLTWWVDSLVNLEFKGHPHTNKTDVAWLSCFQEMGLQLEEHRKYNFLVFFKQTLYCLKTASKDFISQPESV